MMKIRVRDRAAFQADKMAKVALASTPHAHDGQDKIYVVLEGRGRFTVGEADETLEAGEAVVAPAGVTHGLVNDGDRALLVLVVVTPPPPHA
jgi:quercetin dioxygenase-like cupin family protein